MRNLRFNVNKQTISKSGDGELTNVYCVTSLPSEMQVEYVQDLVKIISELRSAIASLSE